MRVLLVLITLLLQSCTMDENGINPFGYWTDQWVDDVVYKYGPNLIMSGYELMERDLKRKHGL